MFEKYSPGTKQLPLILLSGGVILPQKDLIQIMGVPLLITIIVFHTGLMLVRSRQNLPSVGRHDHKSGVVALIL
jgi:hypothetical protein